MPHTKVNNFPEMQTYIWKVEDSQVWQYCKGSTNVSILAWPTACAIFDFRISTCTIVITETTPQRDIDHELLHCKGWDHDAGLQQMVDNWNKCRDIRYCKEE